MTAPYIIQKHGVDYLRRNSVKTQITQLKNTIKTLEARIQQPAAPNQHFETIVKECAAILDTVQGKRLKNGKFLLIGTNLLKIKLAAKELMLPSIPTPTDKELRAKWLQNINNGDS